MGIKWLKKRQNKIERRSILQRASFKNATRYIRRDRGNEGHICNGSWQAKNFTGRNMGEGTVELHDSPHLASSVGLILHEEMIEREHVLLALNAAQGTMPPPYTQPMKPEMEGLYSLYFASDLETNYFDEKSGSYIRLLLHANQLPALANYYVGVLKNHA